MLIIAGEHLQHSPLLGTLIPTQQLCCCSKATIGSVTSEANFQLEDEVKKMMKILLGYDGSESADAALRDLKRAGLPDEAEALIVSVANVFMPQASNYEIAEQAFASRRVIVSLMLAQKQRARLLLEAKALTTKAGERVRSYFPGWHVLTEVLAGQASQELIGRADEWKPDLVVVGSHGHSLTARIILGSVSRKIVTDSHHSVRVTRGPVERNDHDPVRIVIGLDGSSEAEHAVRAVGRRMWPDQTEVRIIAVDNGTSSARISRILPIAAATIRDENEESALAAQRMVDWAENELSVIGLNVSVAIEKGDPQRVLIHHAQQWNADSIFVGGRRFRSSLERFRLGSVATGLVTKAHCAVEVARNAIR
jgi:nucleotide-binding universal stress UspA family protein